MDKIESLLRAFKERWDLLVGLAALLGVPADSWPQHIRAAWDVANVMTPLQVALLVVGCVLIARWTARRLRQRRALHGILIDAVIQSGRFRGGTAGMQNNVNDGLAHILAETGIRLKVAVDDMGNRREKSGDSA